MIGEIRDLETATIAINASLTGHLVFSTLHTNDAPSAVTRLDRHRREAVPGGLFHPRPHGATAGAQGLQASAARPTCRPKRNCASLSIDAASMPKAPRSCKGKGCADCSNTGYRGRLGIFEIFVIDDEARKLIYEKVPSSVLRARAREMGMRTLARGRRPQGPGRLDHAGRSHPRDRGRRGLSATDRDSMSPSSTCFRWRLRASGPARRR